MKTRIKEFRARNGLTQEELARKVGVRRETIVFLERGKYNPSLRLAHDIAKVLGSPIEQLFILDEEKQEKQELKREETQTSHHRHYIP